MKMKRPNRILFPLILALVFLFGCVGHWVGKPPPIKESFYTLTVTHDNVNNALLSSLPKEGDTLFFGKTECKLSRIEISPTLLYFRDKGTMLQTESSLYSKVSFSLTLLAHEKDGRLYLDARQLPLGESDILTGENFALSVIFCGISATI